jgi:hypothetical protein
MSTLTADRPCKRLKETHGASGNVHSLLSFHTRFWWSSFFVVTWIVHVSRRVKPGTLYTLPYTLPMRKEGVSLLIGSSYCLPHALPEINITSLSATQGSSEACRTLTPMPDVQHSHNRTMATTTKTLIRGPGSSRNNPIVIVDSDPEDTAECVSPSLSLSARNNPIIIADSDLEDASSDNSPSSDDLEEPSELNDKSSC